MLRKQHAWTLFMYSVPYVYVVIMAMAYHATEGKTPYSFVWIFFWAMVFLPVTQLAICAYRAHQWRTRLWVIPGNLISAGLSYYLLWEQNRADAWFLKPFTPEWALFWMTLLAVIAQLLVLYWCKRHQPYGVKPKVERETEQEDKPEDKG